MPNMGPSGVTVKFTPLRGYTSSGAARHLPLKGKANGGHMRS